MPQSQAGIKEENFKVGVGHVWGIIWVREWHMTWLKAPLVTNEAVHRLAHVGWNVHQLQYNVRNLIWRPPGVLVHVFLADSVSLYPTKKKFEGKKYIKINSHMNFFEVK